MPREYYVSPIVNRWENMTFINAPWRIGGYGKSVGAMMVYESLEDFKKDFPDREPLVMTRIGEIDGYHDNQHAPPQTTE